MSFIVRHKKITILVVLLLFIIGFFLYQKYNKSQIIVFLGEKEYLVDIARSDAELIRGLSGREYLSSDSGMLFVFDYSDKYGIWMRKMKFPIDVIWISEKYQIVHMEKSLATSSYPVIYHPTYPAKYVLEISSGELEKLNIKIGDAVRFVKK